MGGAEAPVTVAFRLPWHFCSPLRYRNGHWQFLHIRNNGRNGLVATESRQILERMVQGEEKRKNYPTKKI